MPTQNTKTPIDSKLELPPKLAEIPPIIPEVCTINDKTLSVHYVIF